MTRGVASHPELDVRIGMLTYARPEWDPLPGRLRERPSDFLVDEVWRGASALMAAAGLESPEVPEGPHAVFSVVKVGLTTGEASRLLARALGIPASRVSYAGLKDRRSVSAQFMSAPLGRPPEVVSAHRVRARFVCRSVEPVYRGSNDLNGFTLRVRETEPRKLSRRLTELAGGFPNFFSYQRFGDRPPLNHEIGLLLLRREFDRAARLLAGKGGRGYESRVAEALDRGSGGLEALGEIPRGALEMMLHSYQAHVFNLILSGRLLDRRISPGGQGDPPTRGRRVARPPAARLRPRRLPRAGRRGGPGDNQARRAVPRELPPPRAGPEPGRWAEARLGSREGPEDLGEGGLAPGVLHPRSGVLRDLPDEGGPAPARPSFSGVPVILPWPSSPARGRTIRVSPAPALRALTMLLGTSAAAASARTARVRSST